MKKLSEILLAISIIASTVTVNAAPVPREVLPQGATGDYYRKSYRCNFRQSKKRYGIC